MKVADRLKTRPVCLIGLLCGVLFAGLILLAGVQGQLGKIGPDNDDVMRLVQVRDLMAGQGWFDHMQSRLGAEGGTLMHWSRLVDAPIAGLTLLFDLVLPYETALAVAYSIWPPLTAGLVVAGVFIGVRRLRGDYAGLIAALLTAIVLLAHFRFAPGAIDHHNLQLGMLALALGLVVGPDRRVIDMAGAGLALAVSIAIGAEVYVFVAIFCGFVALDWAIAGAPARQGAMAFGLALAAGLSILFFTLIAPTDYAIIACDAFSGVSLVAGAAGGLGLAGAAFLTSDRAMLARGASLVGVGILCGVVLLQVGPQCLSNPLDDLSPLAKTLWLDRVSEARPVFAPGGRMFETIPYRLGVIIVAFGLCASWILRRRDVRVSLFLCALMAAAFFTTVYQLRFFAFGHLFAVLPLGMWVADSWIEGKRRNPDSLGYLAAVALSLPMVWGIVGKGAQATFSPEPEQMSTYKACVSDEFVAALNNLPAGRVLAGANFTPYLLLETHHSALNGNYHRNMDAIDASLSMLVSDQDEVAQKMRQWGVDYVLVCKGDRAAAAVVDYAPNGLLARLERGDVPVWLNPVAGVDAGDVQIRVYQLRN